MRRSLQVLCRPPQREADQMSVLIRSGKWKEAVALLPSYIHKQQQVAVKQLVRRAYRQQQTDEPVSTLQREDAVHRLMSLCLVNGRPEVADAIYEHVLNGGDHLGAVDASPAPFYALTAMQVMGRQWRRSLMTLDSLAAVPSGNVRWRWSRDSVKVDIGGRSLTIAPQTAIEAFVQDTRERLAVLRRYGEWSTVRRLALYRMLRLCNSVRLRSVADPWDLVLLGNEVLESTANLQNPPALKQQLRQASHVAGEQRLEAARAELPSDPSANDPLAYISLNCHNFDELLVRHLARVCAHQYNVRQIVATSHSSLRTKGGSVAADDGLKEFDELLFAPERATPAKSFAAVVARSQQRERRALIFPDASFVLRYFERLVSLSQHREVMLTYSVIAEITNVIQNGGVHRYAALKKLHLLLRSLSRPPTAGQNGPVLRDRDGVSIFGLVHELYACQQNQFESIVPSATCGTAGRIALVAKTASQCRLIGEDGPSDQGSLEVFLADLGLGDSEAERLQVVIATHSQELRRYAHALAIPVVH